MTQRSHVRENSQKDKWEEFSGSSSLSGSHVWLVYAAIFASMAGVFIADWFTPLGIAVWVVYIIPVTMTFFLLDPRIPILVAIISSVLLALTFMTDDAGVNRDIAFINRVFGGITVWVIAIVGHFFTKARIAIRRQHWLNVGRAGLSQVMGGEKNSVEFGEATLTFLAEYVQAHVGALFIRSDTRFGRVATYGLPEKAELPTEFTLHDGLLGQAVRDGRSFVIDNVPPGYLQIGSALGQTKPATLVIVPAMVDGAANAVIELGFLSTIDERVRELLDGVSESIAVAVRSGVYRAQLQHALEETQQQAEELQVQSEELRVSNEELEEQSRALQESQMRLEQQQVELEQTNVQLEEQAQALEAQRDDLARARAAIEMKIKEVEQASSYKSSFLANMSHELRTPLNSSLILARLLADNTLGNLTDDQVKSAQTILASGNDLLTLINDILDLSKIESGRMEIHIESTRVSDVIRKLLDTIRPAAELKGLELDAKIEPGVPEFIDTDRLRLEQVLKNLLSNAVKFTDRGNVKVTVANVGDGSVMFRVLDTGIGISPDQQNQIFDAFHQIDGKTNRKAGGTGLGLSISRELTRLLGGKLSVRSELGKGSEFEVCIPVHSHPNDRLVSPSGSDVIVRSTGEESLAKRERHEAHPEERITASRPFARLKDDREHLDGTSRIILIVEDDEPFATILYQLAHDHHFHCILGTSAEEGLAMAKQFLPSAIILDIGLPDHSGLMVLDSLKNDVRTRHIPVHVISASDYAETAMTMGAIGYMLKPVSKEKLVETLESLEAIFVQRMRRVLVVEDDEVQLESIRKLLGSEDVVTVGAQSAAECLALLKANTFDCMVLDLTLPDETGYGLLETLSREDAYSFPPVIIYTGRDLSVEDETRLRRYSKSIIIKGAKSPERLLDEVTLFLHQLVAELPTEQQQMIEKARSREAHLEGRRILVVEDDVRNVFALTSILEPRGAIVQIARNGREAIESLESSMADPQSEIDLVLMDVMMPEVDGLTATREIRMRPEWKKLPIIMLTAKAMKDDQESCFAAGANDYLAKPLDVDKLLSLIRVWIRR